MREVVGKSWNIAFSQWFGAPEGRKVGSLKRRVRSQLARWEMINCTPLWREAHFQVKMYKKPQRRTTFGNWDVEKVHAVVARSTFGRLLEVECPQSARRCGAKHMSKSKCTQSTPFSDHFWQLRCRKSARRCGAKHIWKSKCWKHRGFGPLLEVQISKKCTPLWREAHFEVKMLKTLGVQTTFWKFKSRKSARRCGAKHILKSKCTKHHMFAPLLEVQMSLRFASLHYTVTTLHYTTLHYTTLRYTTLHNTTTTSTQLDSTRLHYTPLH